MEANSRELRDLLLQWASGADRLSLGNAERLDLCLKFIGDLLSLRRGRVEDVLQR